MPYMIVKHDADKMCVHKKNTDGTAGESMQCYTGPDAEAKCKEYMKTMMAEEEKKMSSFSGLISSIKNLLHLAGGDSLDEKLRAVRESFYQTFERVYEPAPGCYVDEVYDSYVIAEEGDKKYKVSYTIAEDGTVSFAPREEWKQVQETYVEMQSSFSFTELSADIPSTPTYIDGLAAGSFVSMTGEEVEFKPEDLSAYIENTQAIIESTRTEKGEIVGLPIDRDRHDHAGGAGWIVGLELDQERNIIRFLVNWTKEGVDLIKGNIRRFFSPSADPNNKVILGGSLTNWPATRLETGQILLRPVELSQSIKEIDMPKTMEEMFADLKAGILAAVGPKPAELQVEPAPAATPEPLVSPSLRELLNTPEAVEELGRKATEIAQDAIKAEKRKLHAVEFASKIVGGTQEKPFGLRVKPAEIVALLLSLPEKQALAVEKILAASLDAAIDFAEKGFDSEGFIQKPQLPATIKPYARQWVANGKPLSEFFAQNPELGPADQYNLVEFMKVQE